MPFLDVIEPVVVPGDRDAQACDGFIKAGNVALHADDGSRQHSPARVSLCRHRSRAGGARTKLCAKRPSGATRLRGGGAQAARASFASRAARPPVGQPACALTGARAAFGAAIRLRRLGIAVVERFMHQGLDVDAMRGGKMN